MACGLSGHPHTRLCDVPAAKVCRDVHEQNKTFTKPTTFALRQLGLSHNVVHLKLSFPWAASKQLLQPQIKP